MATRLLIVKTGPGATIQDQGRLGYLRFGVTTAGPMDWVSHARANLLAGNPEGAAAIEIGIGGIEVQADGGPVVLGYAGAPFAVSCRGSGYPFAGRVRLDAGDRLAVRSTAQGSWFYVSLAGGIRLPPVMGSLATSLRTGIGPPPLASGDSLEADHQPDLPDLTFEPGSPVAPQPVRVVLGPQDDFFSTRGLETFFEEPYGISVRSDRMGYRLEGTPVEHAQGYNIVSDAIALGAIQVPGDGMPIVLMADHQPTGGYPKLGHVIRADIGRLAQCRPGERVRFAVVSVEAARSELLATVQSLRSTLEQAASGASDLSSEHLLSVNLISGMHTET